MFLLFLFIEFGMILVLSKNKYYIVLYDGIFYKKFILLSNLELKFI